MSRVRILADWDSMPIWFDTETREVIVDWYGWEVIVGKAGLSEEHDVDGEDWQTWMFYENEKVDLHGYLAPEGRYSLGDVLDEGLAEKLDDWITDYCAEHYFVGSPTKLLFGAEAAPDMDMEEDE